MSSPNPPSRQPTNWGAPDQPGPPSSWGPANSAWNPPEHQQPAEAPAPGAPRRQAPQSAAGREPRRAAQQPQLSIRQFTAKPKRTLPMVLALVAALVVGGMLYFGTRPETPTAPTPSPSVTSRPAPTPATPGEFASSIQFASDRVAGTFSVNDSLWEDSMLIATVTVSVDEGSLDYQFITMHMESGDIYAVEPPREPGDLPGGIVSAGESVTGTVRVAKPRGDTQLLLSDASRGRNLTMLAIAG